MKVWEAYIPYLHMAMASELGIVIVSSNPKLSQANLYLARAKLGDPDHARLQFRPDPIYPDQFLWIIKGPETSETTDGN